MSEPNTNTNNPSPAPAPETPPPAPETPPEKTFNQAQVDAIVGRRVAAAMKGVPGKEELEAFRAWKESQQTEQERWNTLTQERDTARTELTAAQAELTAAQAELEQYKREKFLLGKGVSAEDADYYAFKIAKLVTDTVDFETAAEQFLKDNPPAGTVRVDLSAPLGGGQPSKTVNETMNSLIRGARK